MANGAFKFKDNSGNVVSFISGSGPDIIMSGGTLNLSGMTGLTLGNLTMSGTTQNAISASHAASYLLTSSFNSYTGTTNTIIGSLQTSTGSLNSFTSSAGSRLTSIETSTSSLNSYTSSNNTRLGVIESTTGSLNTFTSSANGRLNTIEGVTGSYATTGSNTFNGNLTVTGYIDTQELRTTYISSSILYRSGSTKFGDELTDTHAFTGSLLVSGSSNHILGNLGVGRTDVSKKLDIYDANVNGTDDVVRVYQNVTTNHAWYRSQRNGGANMIIGATRDNVDGNIPANSSLIWNSSNHDIVIGTNNIERFKVLNGGDLLITGNGKFLQAVRNTGGAIIDILGIQAGTDTLQIKGGTSGGSNAINFYDTGGLIASFYNSNFGIGTSTPSSKLSVHGQFRVNTTNSDGNENRLFFNPGGSADPAQLYLYNEAQTNTIYLTANGASFLNSGALSIGTTNTPEGKLDIKGGALVVDVSNNGYGGFKLDDDSNGDYNVNFRAGRGGTNDGFRWYLNARPGGGGAFSTGNERMRLTNTGLGVGIDNPLGKLHIRSSGISASAPSNGWPIYNAEADTNARRIYIDTAGNDNVGTAGYGATAAIELCGYFDSRAVITTQAAGSTSPSDQGTGRGKDLMIKAGASDNTNGYKGGRLYLNGGIGYQGGFGANGGDILMQVLGGSGNVGINQTQPQTKLDVNGNIKNGGRVYSGNSVIGNIATNLDSSFTRSYLLICDLNDIAGFSLNGFMNAASYTCWNMSSFYIMKNYSSTTATAGITGQFKAGGCDMNIVDLSYGGGRYIAIGYTSNPEIDVIWTGYRLLHMLNADGSAQVIRQSYVTVNSTLATY